MGTLRFRAVGIVREEGTGLPVAGVRVCAYDRDLVIDDPLGEVTTAADGRFEIVFTDLAFRDVIEQRPDLYLRVLEVGSERELLSTRHDTRYDARSQEYFELAIVKERLTRDS